MKTTSYETLLATREEFTQLLDRLDVRYGSSNRWFDTYRLVEKLNVARLNDTVDAIDPAEMGRMRFALLDLSELQNILDSIKETDENEILKSKMETMLQGVADRTQETASNTRARDVQLELVLNAVFRNAGLDSHLSDPNPDLLINTSDRQYGIECKRIFTTNPNSVVRSVANAAEQLRNRYIDDDKHGLIAIAIDRFLTGGDKILESGSELSARVFLSHEVGTFIDANSRRWSKYSIIKDERIAGILVYMSFAGIAKEENIPIHAAQSGITDVYWTQWGIQNFNYLKNDIADPMLAAAGDVNEAVRVISDAAMRGNNAT